LRRKAIHDNEVVHEFANDYTYFACIKFINSWSSVIPFTQNSSTAFPFLKYLVQINTREKLSSGMIKVYAAEVLGKLLVIQHFPFGSILYEGPPPPSGTGEESAHHTHIHGGGVIVWDTYPECCYDAARQNDGGT
ncbi:hypothetical protein M404DRAFT_156087, partial [Pisolithus tinctorius Marx 270]